MLLIDANQVFISSIIASKINDLDEDIIKHVILNSLRNHTKKFKDYGEVILCIDSKHYWRKEFFPFYKSHRKELRERSPLDWNQIFRSINSLKEDLKNHFPYKILEVYGAEADDIIGTLTPRFSSSEKVLIVSSDKDFIQLQKYPNVKQYNPMLNVYVTSKNPKQDLKEKIIKGDRGDNINNILTDTEEFVSGKRQKSISTKKLEEWLEQDPKICFDSVVYDRYKRNEILISFDFIPIKLRESIIKEYEFAKPAKKNKLYKYFVEKRMINLLDVIDEF